MPSRMYLMLRSAWRARLEARRAAMQPFARLLSPLDAKQSKTAWSPCFWVGFAVCGIVLGLVVPMLNLWVPPGSAAALPDYLVPLLGKYLCYALLALSLDLIWGYAGILSLGHGAFFALGGYCMGMYLM